MGCEGYWPTLLICVVLASHKVEECNEKHLGPWQEVMGKPNIPPSLMELKLKENPAATIKENFKKIIETVSSVTPKQFKARGIKFDQIVTSAGLINGLKKAFSNPKSLSVTQDDHKTLHLRFTVDLAELRVKYYVNASKLEFNNDMQWKFRKGSIATVKIAIKFSSGCSLYFGDTEVTSSFDHSGKSTKMTVLTNKLKCYIHMVLQQAVNFVLQILKEVLQKTVCRGLKAAVVQNEG